MKTIHACIAAAGLAFACVGLAQDKGGSKEAPAKDNQQPPAEYVLEIDGKQIDVQEGRPTEIKVGDRTVTATVRQKGDRLFDEGGVSFRYPNHLSFERDNETEGVTIWMLDGNDTVVMVNQLSSKVSGKEFASRLVDEMAGALKAKPKSSTPVSMKLGPRQVEGTRHTFVIATVVVTFEVYPLATAGETTTVLCIQDMPDDDDGTMTEETRKAKELISKTFEYTKGRL